MFLMPLFFHRWQAHGSQSDKEDPIITSFNNLKNALNTIDGEILLFCQNI